MSLNVVLLIGADSYNFLFQQYCEECTLLILFLTSISSKNNSRFCVLSLENRIVESLEFPSTTQSFTWDFGEKVNMLLQCKAIKFYWLS